MRPLLISLFLVSLACAIEDVMDENMSQPIDVHMALARPINKAAGGCMDVYTQCKQWARQGACRSPRYTTEAKRSLCGVSCGLCRSQGASDTSAQPSESESQLTDLINEMAGPVKEMLTNINELVKLGKQTLEGLAKQGQVSP